MMDEGGGFGSRSSNANDRNIVQHFVRLWVNPNDRDLETMFFQG